MDPITLRAVERIIAVIIGGLCIWLGQRLFLRIPEQKESEGKVQFPGGISVYVARVGPGVFFALFGAVLVGMSFYRGVELQSIRLGLALSTPATSAASPNLSAERFEYRGAGALIGADESGARADERALQRKSFARLNNLSAALRRDLPAQERKLFLDTIADVKLALMRPIWDDTPGGWGDRAAFEHWVTGGEQEPPPAALKSAVDYYRQGVPARP